MNIVLVAVGGFIGSVLRYLLSIVTDKKISGTLIVNVTGSLLLAMITLLYTKDLMNEQLFLFSGVGFCGAYTTFSTFGNELLSMIFAKKYGQALLYTGSSLGLAIFFVILIFNIF